MQLRSAISKDGRQVFVRNDVGEMQLVERMNSAIHPFLRGMEGMSNIAGDRLVKPFAESVWVMRAIKTVAEPIAAVPVGFYNRNADGTLVEIKDPALLTFWEQPAIDRSGPVDRADFIEALICSLKLHGEYFILLDDTWLTQRFAKIEARSPVIVARPEKMRPILEEGILIGWEYTDANGKRHGLTKDQVIHRKFHNPYDDLRGLSEYEAAHTASEADYLAGKFSLNLNRANGDRGVIVVAKGGMPSDEQQEQIVRALRSKADAAKQGNYRPIFLAGDVAIEDPKVNAPDADFIAARLENRHEIAIAFGVPPSMFDVVASYSIGSASDRFRLIIETCIPLANGKVSGGIAEVSRRMFAGGNPSLTVRSKFDEHPVMQEVRRGRIDAGVKLWGTGWSWDAINEYLDMGAPKFEGSAKSYVPFNLQEVGADSDVLPKTDATPDDPAKLEEGDDKNGKDEDPVQNLRLIFERQSPVALLHDAFNGASAALKLGARQASATPDLGALFRGICCGHTKSTDYVEAKDRDPKRVKQAQAHLRSRGPAIKRTKAKFTKALMFARGQVLAKLEKGGKGSRQLSTKAAAADFMFDLNEFKTQLHVNMRKAAMENLNEAGQQLFDEVGFKDNVFTMPPAEAHRFLQRRENLMSGVADGVFDEIKGDLQKGIDTGESTAELAARVRAKCNDIEDGRALTVAQTEVGAAYGEARQCAMDDAGIEWKEWLTSGLPTVRATHLEAEGQRVRTNDTFDVGGSKLQFPGDPAGDASEVINCHCVSIPVEGPEEDGK